MPETLDEVLDETELFPLETPEDPNQRTHIINHAGNKDNFPPGYTAKEMAKTATQLGMELLALCGHRWVPKYDPMPLPICQACKDEWERILKELGR